MANSYTTKNILILTPFYPPNVGGAETFTEGLVKEASKWFQITVLTFMPFQHSASSYQEKYWKMGSLKIYRIKWPFASPKAWKGTSLTNMLLVFPKLAACSFLLCLRKEFEIVHSQGLLSAMVGVFITKIFRSKHYVTLLALYNFREWKGLKKYLVKFIFKNCDQLFVEGKTGLKDVMGLGYIPDTKLFTHWCDPDKFRPDPKRQNDKIRVLFVGRPIPEKGMHIVQAAQRLLNDPDKYEFTYVTEAKYSDLPKIYQRHHILVVPSLYDEGHTRVVIEGASCGCAIVVSNRGSLPEQVMGFGHIFNENLVDIIPNINIIKNSPEKSRSYVYARENFTPKNAEVFLDAYSR